MEKQKRSISERINARFAEPEDGIFKDGKWRWWFALVFGLSLGSAIVTALIFSGSLGALAIGMGVLVLWTLVGTLVYSDSKDSRLARGVSILDSIALCFVVAHFCFAAWVYGHLLTLQKDDAKYEREMVAYNLRSEKIQSDNVKIAASAERIAEQATKAERLRNDTAYWQARAAKTGARIPAARQSSGVSPSLSTAQVELVKPAAPKESAAAFLSRWDSWIRLANFGELILAAVTLIYIRNRSAAFNAKNAATAFQSAGMSIPAPVATLRHPDRETAAAVATDLDRLRAHLKDVAFYYPGRWFKVDPLEAGDGLWVRFCERRKGRERTIAKVKWNNRVFAELDRADFQTRLRQRLIDAGFPIGGEHD